MKAKIICLVALAAMLAGAQAECNDCILQVIPLENDLCQGEPAVFEIRLTNVYDQSKTISLSHTSDIQLTSDMPSQMTIEAYGTRSVRATFTPRQAVLGQHRLTVTASGYGAEDSDDAVFTINDCYAMGLDLTQSSVDLCEGSKGRVDVIVTNHGQKTDTYSLSVGGIPDTLEVSFTGGQMTLAPGASRTVSLTVEAVGDDYGEYDLQVTADSSMKSMSREFRVNLLNCYQVFVTAPKEFSTCLDAGLAYTATVKNTGCVADEYHLSLSGSCAAHLDADYMRLEPGEARNVVIRLDPVLGECETTLTAASEYDSDSATTQVRISDCWGVDLEILPPQAEACHGEPFTFDMRVTNTGFYTDTYSLTLNGLDIELEQKTLRLASGETRVIPLDIRGTWCVIGDIRFSATAAGHASDTDSAELRLLPKGEMCADLELAPSQEPASIDCEGDAFKFYVKNTGYTKQDISLSVQGAADYVLQPRQFMLRATETRPVALYLRPSGAKKSRISITATSEYKRAYLELDVDFTGPCTVSRPEAVVAPKKPTQPVVIVPPPEEPGSESPEEPGNESESPAGGSIGTPGTGLDLQLILLISLAVIAVLLLAALLWSRDSGGEGEEPAFPEVAATYESQGSPRPRPADAAAAKEDQLKRLASIKQAVSRAAAQ